MQAHTTIFHQYENHALNFFSIQTLYAEYGEYEAVFTIESGELINGKLPTTAKKLVSKWHKLYR